MAIKINWNDLQKRFVGTTEIVRVYKAGVQVRPDTVPPVFDDYLCFEGNVWETDWIWLEEEWDADGHWRFEYSYDKSTRTEYDPWDWLDISNWAKVYFRAITLTPDYSFSSNNFFQFYTSTNSWIKVSGNVTTMLCRDGTTTLSYYCFYRLFYWCNIVTAPTLPATTLDSNCCEQMFADTNITTAPVLPAIVYSGCYRGMFSWCTNLTTAPTLPATTMAYGCYEGMFNGCTSLITPPSLPATTLAQNCYGYMFQGCTSLTTVPQLPATTIDGGCYRGMFNGCTSLTALPSLPATRVWWACYESMFNGCTSIKLSATQTWEYQTPYRIPTTWQWDASNPWPSGWDRYMFDNTGGTFTWAPSINTTYYTSNTII